MESYWEKRSKRTDELSDVLLEAVEKIAGIRGEKGSAIALQALEAYDDISYRHQREDHDEERKWSQKDALDHLRAAHAGVD